MAAHELYTDHAPGLDEERTVAKERVAAYNASSARDTKLREALLREMFGSIGDSAWVEPPVLVAYGTHTHFGDNVYANFGLTLVDDVEVFIGDRVMFAPHVTITTTGHPVHPALRSDGTQFSAPVRIEDDVWIGTNVTILPGVTIGRGSVVGAGSVVTRNVPPNVVVAGTPARILREITDEDREFRYTPPRDMMLPDESSD